jgi:predicted small integral membrane protein
MAAEPAYSADDILRLAQVLTKAALASSVGLFGLLVAAFNIIDYGLNWQFVQHVLAMDAMKPFYQSNSTHWRAITDPAIQTAFYWTIIAGEALVGLLCGLGGLLILIGGLSSRRRVLTLGKAIFCFGCLVALLVWYTGFAVVGGEYFAMWASTWDGQMKAYAFSGFILLSLVYVSQRE